MFPRICAFLLLLSAVGLRTEPLKNFPVVAGYVTSINQDGSFGVEGTLVVLADGVTFSVFDEKLKETSTPSFKPFVGEFVQVMGSYTLDKAKNSSVAATHVAQVLPTPRIFHGFGIIDFVPEDASVTRDRLVRADGYILRIPLDADVKFQEPLSESTGFATNVWIAYHGALQPDGTVLVDDALLQPNVVKAPEQSMKNKKEYDPSTVDPEVKQGALSKTFAGIDLKRLPPHLDTELETRVTRIGESLIPAYQRKLAPDDPTRLHFRFQVVDVKEFREPRALPNGIIVVPYVGLDRLKSDSEIAALLAVPVAAALEKIEWRGRPAKYQLTTADILGDAAGFLIPGAGLGMDVVTGLTRSHLEELHEEQSGRVALCLLHDAGYDIHLAPLALWLTTPAKIKPIEQIKMPARVASMYNALGTTWQPGSIARTH